MAKRRVADVVGQAAGGDDGRQFIFVELAKALALAGVFIGDSIADGLSKGPADRSYFETMRKPVVDEDRAGQGEHLGLVLEAPEGRGEDDAIVIS
jgi:hypothetical protein